MFNDTIPALTGVELVRHELRQARLNREELQLRLSMNGHAIAYLEAELARLECRNDSVFASGIHNDLLSD